MYQRGGMRVGNSKTQNQGHNPGAQQSEDPWKQWIQGAVAKCRNDPSKGD